MEDPYQRRSYSAIPIGFGDQPAVAVVDFQLAFTDPSYPMGGGAHIERAVRNTARLLNAARRRGIPVACCYEAYSSSRQMPYWKIGAVSELIHGHPGTELDKRIYDPTYDIAICKSGPSIFFHVVRCALFHQGTGRYGHCRRRYHERLHELERWDARAKAALAK